MTYTIYLHGLRGGAPGGDRRLFVNILICARVNNNNDPI